MIPGGSRHQVNATNHNKPFAPSQRWYRILPFLGLVSGGLLGFFDAVYFSSIDLTAEFGGQELNPAVVLGFTVTLALFGYLVGRLIVAGARARADRATIAEQHDALVQSQLSLVQQEKLAALGRLVASIAHELRNPLGVIRSAAGILDEGTRSAPAGEPELQHAERQRDKLRRAAELVTEEVDHMNATITALLAFARPANLQLEAVALDQIFDRAQHLTEERAQGRIEIERRLPQPMPQVVGDFNLLTQVVAGLLDNAIEASIADGEGRIELRAERADGAAAGTAEGAVHIEVADDGPGITADDALHVFEPFFTTKAKGTGLGLALAHRVADAHGGHLEVVTEAGTGDGRRGACLRLSLPLPEVVTPTDEDHRPMKTSNL